MWSALCLPSRKNRLSPSCAHARACVRTAHPVRLEKVVTGIEESFALPDVTIEGERVPVDHRELALAKA